MAFPLANVVGGPLSSLILGMHGFLGLAGWRWLFLLEGAPAILLAFAVLRFLPDKPQHAPWLNDEERTVIAAGLTAEDTSDRRAFGPALFDIRVWALGIVYFGYSVGLYGVGLWLPQIVQGMGLSNLATGFAVAPPYIASAIAMVLWSRASDKSGERIWHVALAALLMVFGLVVASLASSNLVTYLALSLVVVGSMALQGPFWALPAAFLGAGAAAGGIALINTIGTGGGGFAGPYIVGLFRDATGGYAAGMAALALGPTMTAAIVLFLGRAGSSRKYAIKQTV